MKLQAQASKWLEDQPAPPSPLSLAEEVQIGVRVVAEAIPQEEEEETVPGALLLWLLPCSSPSPQDPSALPGPAAPHVLPSIAPLLLCWVPFGASPPAIPCHSCGLAPLHPGDPGCDRRCGTVSQPSGLGHFTWPGLVVFSLTIDEIRDSLDLDIPFLNQRCKRVYRSLRSTSIYVAVKERQLRLTSGRNCSALASFLGIQRSSFQYDTLLCKDGSYADPVVIHLSIQRRYMRHFAVDPDSLLYRFQLDLPDLSSAATWEVFLADPHGPCVFSTRLMGLTRPRQLRGLSSRRGLFSIPRRGPLMLISPPPVNAVLVQGVPLCAVIWHFLRSWRIGGVLPASSTGFFSANPNPLSVQEELFEHLGIAWPAVTSRVSATAMTPTTHALSMKLACATVGPIKWSCHAIGLPPNDPAALVFIGFIINEYYALIAPTRSQHIISWRPNSCSYCWAECCTLLPLLPPPGLLTLDRHLP
jgi:hypothetical protein